MRNTFFALALMISGILSAHADRYITYTFSGGRFGDCLMCYLHAKWLSYEFDLPLVYQPFSLSDQLVLDDNEIKYDPSYFKNKRRGVILGKQDFSKFFDPAYEVFFVPYFPEAEWERKHTRGPYNFDWQSFAVTWEDKNFKRICRECVAPKKNLPLIYPPKDCVSVALHLRTGHNYDTDGTRRVLPTKFPSTGFYLEGLLEVISLFKDKPIYCYIFSDTTELEGVIKKISSRLPKDCSIEFVYRKETEKTKDDVLIDFFSFFNFDVLIYPESNFSMVPALIGDFALTFTPLEVKYKENISYISKMKIEKNFEKIKEVMHR